MLKIISLFVLMHYLVVVLPAPHEDKLDSQQVDAPALANKHLLSKPRVKNLGAGSLDIDQNVPFVVPFIILALPRCVDFALVADAPIVRTFSAFLAQAPPVFSSNH